jgi:hypothetical protein
MMREGKFSGMAQGLLFVAVGAQGLQPVRVHKHPRGYQVNQTIPIDPVTMMDGDGQLPATGLALLDAASLAGVAVTLQGRLTLSGP